jgi:hypothetical protein
MVEENLELIIDTLVGDLLKDPVNIVFPPASPEEITEVIEMVDKKLPPSYERFLQRTNGALLFQALELYGTSSNGVIPESIRDLPPPGVPSRLTQIIYAAEPLYLDAGQIDEQEEQPVVRCDPDTGEISIVAPNFATWLRNVRELYR